VAARSAGKVIGVVVVVLDSEGMRTNLLSIAVELRYRRIGLARRLIHAALAQLSEQVRTVSLEVRVDNAGARALYERIGFRVSRRMRKYYADGGDAMEYCAPIQGVLDACQATWSAAL
jgi:ribosomal-protein-alanine N-acetyltransferase